jgi:regulator of cell morphogenesis and NO signaling
MPISNDQTVRQIVNEYPAIIPVFQRYGIDFCCGGEKSLTEACTNAKVTPQIVLDAFEASRQLNTERATEQDWTEQSLGDLTSHIIRTHHLYVRNESARIEKLLTKVPDKHGAKHPELFHVRDLFTAIAAELAVHMMKEEQILFPFINRLEESAIAHEPAIPSTCFGSVGNPIRMMEHEHESAGQILRDLRATTNGYTAPEDACDGFRSLYSALADFESDLHIHIHKENNILHPRALALESATAVHA